MSDEVVGIIRGGSEWSEIGVFSISNYLYPLHSESIRYKSHVLQGIKV